MKFLVSFKTPDALDQALEEHMHTHCVDHDEHDQYCQACASLEEAACDNIEQIKQVGSKFIEYGEYITIEFDTDSGTATVVPARGDSCGS